MELGLSTCTRSYNFPKLFKLDTRLLQNMAQRKREDVDLHDHPCFRNDLTKRELITFRQELIALRRNPNLLQQLGNTERSRVGSLQEIDWSCESIAKVTGVSFEQQRAWRRGDQAMQQH